MKNFAKLILFFCSCFAVFFLTGVFLRFLSSWIDLVRFIPLGVRIGEEAANAAWNALPAALFLSILLCLSYTARREIPIPLSIFCIIGLGFAFTTGISLGIERIQTFSPILNPPPIVKAEPGLILSQSNNAIILMRESTETKGPRVVSFPDQAFIYQEQPIGPNNTIISLPPLPFGFDAPWFIRSLTIDLSLCARQLRSRLEEDFLYFAAYAFTLILLLSSMRFLLELSQWPLANLFLGALVFRLILSLEVFLNTREINTLLGSYLAGRVPSLLITPLIFGASGFLIILFTLISRIARSGARSGGNKNE